MTEAILPFFQYIKIDEGSLALQKPFNLMEICCMVDIDISSLNFSLTKIDYIYIRSIKYQKMKNFIYSQKPMCLVFMAIIFFYSIF